MQVKKRPKSKVKDRLLKFIELKSISVNQFHKKIEIANGYLGKVENIGSNIIEKISETYPELNIDWLFTGRGNMLRAQTDNVSIVNEDQQVYGVYQKEISELRAELIAEMKRNRQLEKELHQYKNLPVPSDAAKSA